MKRANKGAQPERIGQPPAEFVEKRPWAKGNSRQAAVTDTQRSEAALNVLFWGAGGSINASAFDLRQEPGAVVPHAGICPGGAPQGASLPGSSSHC